MYAPFPDKRLPRLTARVPRGWQDRKGDRMSAPGNLLADSTPGGCRARAALGGAVWAVVIAWLQPGWAEALLWLAPLVVVPLGLALLVPTGHEPAARPLRLAALAQVPAALLLVGVLLLPSGLA